MSDTQQKLGQQESGHTCSTCKHWSRLGDWWGKCNNENRTAIETDDPGAGPEMTRKTFTCSAWITTLEK